MPEITIDNKPYDLDSLSNESKAQLGSLRFVDSEIARLQAQLAAMQTARIGYANALKAELAKTDVLSLSGDTIKFT
jgi:hypothetical protein